MYLLDTNALLFFLYDNEKLSKNASEIHGDPFDRLIISQAITENLIIITKDGIIPQYDVKVLW